MALADNLARQGKHEQAEIVMCSNLQVARSTAGLETDSVIDILSQYARLLVEQNKLEDAEPVLLEHFSECVKAYGPVHEDIATHSAALRVAGVLEAQDKLLEAIHFMAVHCGARHQQTRQLLCTVAERTATAGMEEGMECASA